MKYLLALLFLVVPVHAQDKPVLEPNSFSVWEDGNLDNKFTTHRESEQHYSACLSTVDAQQAQYDACALNNFQLWNALFECLYPPTAPINCASMSDFSDGPGGNLWKPRSDHKPTPVFLLPGSYESVRGVEVYEKATGQLVAGGDFRTCCPNGGRSHYDVHELASNLDVFNPIIVRMSNGDCFEVPVASQRWD